MSKKNNRKAKEKKNNGVSRRDFLKAAGIGAIVGGLGANIIIPRRACAGKKKLKIMNWRCPNSAFDDWFNNSYAKEWGYKNNTEVIVNFSP
jgi:hypothetical protein